MMNIFKESLFSSSDSTKKTRHHRSKTNDLLQENNALSEPLLSSPENPEDSIELGTMDSDDDDDNNKSKLNVRHITRSRHTKKESTPSTTHGSNSIIIVEKPILPQETLQAFAIRYRVPVSQLKRLNNLQNDQDFYALKHCRVPVRRFGLLHESPSSSTIVDLNEQSSSSINSSSLLSSQQDHHAFLNAMDHDLASMRAKVEQLIETPPTTLIPDQPPVKAMIRSTTKKAKNDMTCDGADCGCKFWHIILVILLIALLVPLVYIYIYLESPIILSEHIPI